MSGDCSSPPPSSAPSHLSLAAGEGATSELSLVGDEAALSDEAVIKTDGLTIDKAHVLGERDVDDEGEMEEEGEVEVEVEIEVEVEVEADWEADEAGEAEGDQLMDRERPAGEGGGMEDTSGHDVGTSHLPPGSNPKAGVIEDMDAGLSELMLVDSAKGEDGYAKYGGASAHDDGRLSSTSACASALDDERLDAASESDDIVREGMVDQRAETTEEAEKQGRELHSLLTPMTGAVKDELWAD